MKRVYMDVLRKHLALYKQMIFISGPRQVGKTTIAKKLLDEIGGLYLNWDQPDDRLLMLGPFEKIIERIGSRELGQEKQIIVFDEVHKYKGWKNHIKGFFDHYKDDVRIIITGSAKLDVYKKGGDSLMGRYFPYSIYPLSLREFIKPEIIKEDLYFLPINDHDSGYERLYRYGGFPDPLIQADSAFSRQWQNSRMQQIFKEDVRDLNAVQDIAQFEILARLIKEQSGQVCNYSSLSKKIRVSDPTVRRWMSVLESMYYSFSVSPWSKNVARSILKEPKTYLWDWSLIEDVGAKFENFVACHLTKYVSFLQDTGRGDFSLYYLRDKEKREVDFVIVKDGKPWILIETKLSNDKKISKTLLYFQEQLQADYVFQVVHEMDYVNQSCFINSKPLVVPAKTFLSQLI